MMPPRRAKIAFLPDHIAELVPCSNQRGDQAVAVRFFAGNHQFAMAVQFAGRKNPPQYGLGRGQDNARRAVFLQLIEGCQPGADGCRVG